jgi:hypothetical protein
MHIWYNLGIQGESRSLQLQTMQEFMKFKENRIK